MRTYQFISLDDDDDDNGSGDNDNHNRNLLILLPGRIVYDKAFSFFLSLFVSVSSAYCSALYVHLPSLNLST